MHSPINNKGRNVYGINKLSVGVGTKNSKELVQQINEELPNKLLIDYSNFMNKILDDQTSEIEPGSVVINKNILYKIKETPDFDEYPTIQKILFNSEYTNFLSMINRNKLYEQYLNDINGRPTVLVVGHNNKMRKFSEDIYIPNKRPNKVYELSNYDIEFTRHAYSCNNLKDKNLETKMGAIASSAFDDPRKDWDPSLTIIGIICSVKKSEQLRFIEQEVLKVCVSCLIRTWETAILLYIQYCSVLELNILPYLKEEEPGGLKRGNYPIQLKWQMYELDIFINTIKKLIQGGVIKNIFNTNKIIIFKISDIKIQLKIDSNEWNYVDNNGNTSHFEMIDENLSNLKSNLENINLKSNFQNVNLKSNFQNVNLKSNFQNVNLKSNNKVENELNNKNFKTKIKNIAKKNLWTLKLCVQNNYVNNIKVCTGFLFNEENLKYTVSACEINCFYNRIRDNKRNKTCEEHLEKYKRLYNQNKYLKNNPQNKPLSTREQFSSFGKQIFKTPFLSKPEKNNSKPVTGWFSRFGVK
jgi:hypothetical protein